MGTSLFLFLSILAAQDAGKEPTWTPHEAKQVYQSPLPAAGHDWKVSFEKPKYSTQWFRLSPDGLTLSSIDINGKLVLWDARTGALLGTLNAPERLHGHMWSPDSKFIVLGSTNLWVWDMQAKRATVWPDGAIGKTRVVHLAFSGDGKVLLTAHNTDTLKLNRATIRAWDFKTKKLLKSFDETYIYGLAVCQTEPAFFFWTQSSGIPRKRSLVSDKEEQLQPPKDYHAWSYHPALASNDRTCYWYSLQDNGLVGYNMEKGKQSLFIRGDVGKLHNQTVLSPDGKWALTGADKRILLWNLDKGKLEKEYRGHAGGLRTLVFTPESRSFISRDVNNNFFRWDLPEKEK